MELNATEFHDLCLKLVDNLTCRYIVIKDIKIKIDKEIELMSMKNVNQKLLY